MHTPLTLSAAALLALTARLTAQVPNLASYQGRVSVGLTNFHGTGQFKFALVNTAGTTAYWRNSADTAPADGVPDAAVSLTVTKGLYSVLLGDSIIPNMAAIPATVWNNADVRLRIWFNDGTNGFQLLTPDQRLAPSGYLPDASVSSLKIAAGAVGNTHIAAGAVNSTQLADNAVTGAKLADNAVGAAELAAGAVGTAQLASGAVTLDRLATTSQPLLLRSFHDPEPEAAALFAESAAAIGTTKLIFGSPQSNDGATDAGAAGLYDVNGTLVQVMVSDAPVSGGRFGASVAGVGAIGLVVGAPGESAGGIGTGRIHQFGNTLVIRLRTIPNPAPATADLFGAAVAASVSGASQSILAGAPGSAGSSFSGSAFLFNSSGNLVRTFENPEPAAGDQFGAAVAIVGTDKVLIAAPSNDTGAVNAGSVYLFNTSGTLLRTYHNPTPAAGELFGLSVAAVGADKVLIGAPGEASSAPNAGGAYLYDLNGTLLRTYTHPSNQAQGGFGTSVATVGDGQVLISAPGDATGAPVAGSAWLYDLNGTTLHTFNNPSPQSGDRFGNAVAAVGTQNALIGARLDDAGATDAGCAWLFSTTQTTSHVPGLAAATITAGAVTSTSLADGAVVGFRHLANGSVGSSQLGDGVVTAPKIATGAVGSAQVSDGSITSTDLATNIGVWAKSGPDISYTAGKVGIGLSDPGAALDVGLTATRRLRIKLDTNDVPAIEAFSTAAGDSLAGYMRMRHAVEIWPKADGTRAGRLDVRSASGSADILLDGATGIATVKAVNITGGADIAEPFHMTGDKIPKGAVVVIDEINPGHLRLSDQPYDTKVAGIVSGANGVNPGIALHQQGVIEGGQNVALSGRVHALADATKEPIQPGDLLTTSGTPGHLMRASDRERRDGAVIGKAMTGLTSGAGYVLVLVNLQ